MAAFSWHETTRILLILPIIKTVGKFGNSGNLCQYFLLRNTDMARYMEISGPVIIKILNLDTTDIQVLYEVL